MIARAVLAAVASAALVPLLGVVNEDNRPPCARATIALTSDIDSARAHPGDTFHFRIVDTTQAAGVQVAAETEGLGVVAIATHAERGGRGGYVVIETRYLVLPGGAHLPVTIDWAGAARATATGASQNIPGIVGAIPLVGYMLGPYGFIHHGKDVTIAVGTKLPVIVGDDAAAGACRIVPASPAPSVQPSPGASPTNAAPSPSAAPSATAAASPSTAP